MIIRSLNLKKGFCTLTVESADDLWNLRRIIRKNDYVTARTSRVIKRESEFSRPDKGERIKITVKINVEEVYLDNTLERLRIRGKVVESSDETISKSTYHTVSLTSGGTITIEKEKWDEIELKLLHKQSDIRYLLVAIDRREAGIGLLHGTHLSIIANVESGVSGKLFAEKENQTYLDRVSEILIKNSSSAKILIGGPGNTKERLANILRTKNVNAGIIEGLDLAGQDGIRAIVKSQSFRKIASNSEAVLLSKAVEEAIKRISNLDTKVANSLERVQYAASFGAVDVCVVSDDVFKNFSDEQKVVDTLNKVEEHGGKVLVADTSLEYGKQVSLFGGIIALLRYPLEFSN